jgi:hypothetical protein
VYNESETDSVFLDDMTTSFIFLSANIKITLIGYSTKTTITTTTTVAAATTTATTTTTK